MKSKLIFLSFIFLIISCTQKEVKNIIPSATPIFTPLAGAQQVTFNGRNSQAQASPLGDRLLFISQERPAHKNPQVYELDFKTGLDRRITFQTGEISHPFYLSDEQIIYASNTDEIKENIAGFNSDGSPQKASELYLSDLYGNQIVRLTHNLGYDNEAVLFSEKKQILIYVSREKGHHTLKKLELKSQKSYGFVSTSGLDLSSPTVSTDESFIAWIETDPTTAKQRVMGQAIKGKKIEILRDEPGDYRDLHFYPDQKALVYSYRKTNQEPYHIELFDLEKKCSQILLSSTDSVAEPIVVSGNPNQLVFTRFNSQNSQIYKMELPLINCGSEPAK